MNGNGFRGFSNDKQRKFYRITRAIKIGNIIATVILLIFIVRYLIGVNQKVSDIQDQEQYIKSLEQIKQIEEAVQKEINERKEQVQNQIKAIEAELEDTIANAENEGRLLVESSIEKARMKANEEAQKTISEAETKAKNISFHYYQTMMKEIMEILLSGIK